MKKLALIAALLSVAGVSQAQMYVEGNLGVTKASAGNVSDNSPTVGFGFGYKISQNLAIDARYQSLYKWSEMQNEQTVKAMVVRAIGILPLSDSFSLNAKIGAGSVKAEIVNGTESASTKGNMTIGVGADYVFNSSFSIGLDVDSYKTKNKGNYQGAKLTAVSINGKYSF
jgi:hypothetical protein